MGLAASQARLRSLLLAKANCENQLIENSRLKLQYSQEAAQIADEYNLAANKKIIKFNTGDSFKTLNPSNILQFNKSSSNDINILDKDGNPVLLDNNLKNISDREFQDKISKGQLVLTDNSGKTLDLQDPKNFMQDLDPAALAAASASYQAKLDQIKAAEKFIDNDSLLKESTLKSIDPQIESLKSSIDKKTGSSSSFNLFNH